jgi:hypothetical protein
VAGILERGDASSFEDLRQKIDAMQGLLESCEAKYVTASVKEDGSLEFAMTEEGKTYVEEMVMTPATSTEGGLESLLAEPLDIEAAAAALSGLLMVEPDEWKRPILVNASNAIAQLRATLEEE